MALCNIHGLLFLPAFLIIFDSFVQSCRRRPKVGAKSPPPRPTVIPEEGSQESSLRDSNNQVPKKAAQNGNGQRKGPTAPEQSKVTDRWEDSTEILHVKIGISLRPKLERFYSVDLEEQEAREAANPSMDPSGANGTAAEKPRENGHA